MECSLWTKLPDNGPLKVRDVLRSKHPSAKPIQENSLLYGPIDSIDPVMQLMVPWYTPLLSGYQEQLAHPV